METLSEHGLDNCSFQFPKNKQDLIFGLKLGFSCLGILTTLAAILLLIPKHKLLLFKLVLYAMIANGLQVLVQFLEVFPITNDHGFNRVRPGSSWEAACGSFGFLDQVTTWIVHLCLVWVLFYLMYLIVKQKHMEESTWSRGEILGLAVCLLVPLLFNWIPFSHDYYGFSGNWCWIKLCKEDKNGITFVHGSLAYIVIFYYAPLLVFVIINLVSILAIICNCLGSFRYNRKLVLFTLLYPLIYGVLSVVLAISRILPLLHITHTHEHYYPWWTLHAVVDPFRVIFLSFLVICSVLYGKISNIIVKESNDLHNENEQTHLNQNMIQ